MARRTTATLEFLRDAVAQIGRAAENCEAGGPEKNLDEAATIIGLNVRYSGYAWRCTGYGIKATSTAGARQAVLAWAGKVRATAAE